jgi:putative hydrolase of the HAD superfamily
MSKAIIFDWDGVLQDRYSDYASGILAKKLGLSQDYVKSMAIYFNRDYEKDGNCEGFFKQVKDNIGISKEDIINAAKEIPLFETYGIAKRLAQKYHLYILSNQMRWRSDLIRKQYDLSFFKGVFFSNETCVIKPERIAYDDFLKRTGEKAEECIFIDDNPKNTSAAENAGIKSIVFSSCKQLVEELEKLGIRE